MILDNEALAEYDHNIKLADDFILSLAKKVDQPIGKGDPLDFANKFPFIDNEDSLIQLSEDEETEMLVVGPKHLLVSEAHTKMRSFDFERASAIAVELIRRDQDDKEGHEILLDVFNQLGFKNVLTRVAREKVRAILTQ